MPHLQHRAVGGGDCSWCRVSAPETRRHAFIAGRNDRMIAAGSDKYHGKIGSVRLVDGGKLKFTRDANGLHVTLPEKFSGKTAFALKIRS